MGDPVNLVHAPPQRRVVDFAGDQSGQAEDAGHRRAQFMVDVGQEQVLGAVRGVRPEQRGPQILGALLLAPRRFGVEFAQFAFALEHAGFGVVGPLERQPART